MLGKKDIEFIIKILAKQDERITALEQTVDNLLKTPVPLVWAEPNFVPSQPAQQVQQLTLFDQEDISASEAQPE